MHSDLDDKKKPRSLRHDCGGGDLQTGKCQPLQARRWLAIPQGLVVDDTNVMYAEQDVNRITKVGKKCTRQCTVAPPPKCDVFVEDAPDGI